MLTISQKTKVSNFFFFAAVAAVVYYYFPIKTFSPKNSFSDFNKPLGTNQQVRIFTVIVKVRLGLTLPKITEPHLNPTDVFLCRC